MKKILLLGSSGQLGRELTQFYPEINRPNRSELDLYSISSVRSYLKNYQPDLIINCAAYTDVDLAEQEPEKAFHLNAHILSELSVVPAFIHLSTDYVFNGQSNTPYSEIDKIEPINIYGQSKALGEKILLDYNPNSTIIRTSWLYSSHRKNFVKTIDKLCRDKDVLHVVDDQIGTPTLASDLAGIIFEYGIKNNRFKPGIYHYSNEGKCSWFDFAQEIKAIRGYSCKINPVKTFNYPRPAKRPAFSVLDKSKFKNEFQTDIPLWTISLKKFLNTYHDR